MKGYLFIPSFLLSAVLFYLPNAGSGVAESPDSTNGIAQESQNQIVKLTDMGPSPLQLRMKKEDSIAFFLNSTTDSLPTVEIDFKEHVTHCSSGNMGVTGSNKVRSTQPIGIKDFASTCFHEPGTYEFTVYGLKRNPAGIKGSIIVE